MKSWLAKFTRLQEDLERALRRPSAAPKPDPELHNSIMRAVRAARHEEQPRRKPFSLWPVVSGVGVSLAALCVGLLLRPQTPIPSAIASSELAQAPGTALDLGAEAPGLLMAPLSNELARVDHDIHHTTQVLLASFP